MIPFEKLNGAFSALPEEPALVVDENTEKLRNVAAVNTMRLWFNGNSGKTAPRKGNGRD